MSKAEFDPIAKLEQTLLQVAKLATYVEKHEERLFRLEQQFRDHVQSFGIQDTAADDGGCDE